MSYYEIVLPEEEDWPGISSLIARSIPNAIVSHLGRKFGEIFYKSIADNKCSCVYVCKDSQQSLKGVLLGTTDHSESYSGIKENKYKLLRAVYLRLFKWPVLKWIALKVISKMSTQKDTFESSVKAELVVIALSEDFRGKDVAVKLIQKMENFFSKEMGGEGVYYLLTEKSNKRANQFYAKMGAELVATFASQGREINRWHKTFT